MRENPTVVINCSVPCTISTKMFAPIPAQLIYWLTQMVVAKERCGSPSVEILRAMARRPDIHISMSGVQTFPTIELAGDFFEFTGEMIFHLTRITTRIYDDENILRPLCFARRCET